MNEHIYDAWQSIHWEAVYYSLAALVALPAAAVAAWKLLRAAWHSGAWFANVLDELQQIKQLLQTVAKIGREQRRMRGRLTDVEAVAHTPAGCGLRDRVEALEQSAPRPTVPAPR
ncbi:MAG: hypothetical protein ABSG68_26715 [Thermoguttaceae bacterium]|jgi:hypothetical protein